MYYKGELDILVTTLIYNNMYFLLTDADVKSVLAVGVEV